MTKENKVAVSIIVGAALIAVAIYLGLTQKLTFEKQSQEESGSKSVTSIPTTGEEEPATKEELAPSPTVEPTAVTSPTSSPTPTPEITWRKSDIITALSEKTGIPEDEINFSIGEQLDQGDKILLRGGVSREGEMGGAAFFAVVDENGVQVTYAGQGVPECSEVNPYGYPTSWADYCVDENGQTVAR